MRRFVHIGSVSLFALIAAACSEERNDPIRADASGGADASIADQRSGDSGPPADASGADAGAPLDGTTMGTPDGSARDALPGLDVQPDDSLTGTTLEGIQLDWNEDLDLCSGWREGRSLADEESVKVRAHLPRHARGGLSRAELAASALTAGTILHGPLADDRREIQAGQVTTTLGDFRVVRLGGGSDAMSAEIRHDLGAGGIVSEQLYVVRNQGDRRPVTYSGPMSEVSFAFKRAGAPETHWTPIGRCGGAPELDEAAEVIGATAPGGRHVTVLRFLRTREAFAGSAPVHLLGATFYDSGRFGPAASASGPWAQTYSAQHHNWAEHTAYDFRRDLSAHELVFEPFDGGVRRPGRVEIERAELIGLANGGMPGTLRLTELDLETGARSMLDLTIAGGLAHRVDALTLSRELTCPGAQVIGVGDLWSGRFFQLLTCPGAGPLGFSLEKVVPVVVPDDATQAGRRIGPNEMTMTTRDGRAGVRVAVGQGWFFLARLDATDMIIEMADATGQVVYNGLAQPTPLRFEPPRDEVVRARSAAGDVELELVRRWAAQGVGESSIYAPVSFDLRFGTERHRVDAWDRLEYENTHHNWNDDAVALTDRLEMVYRVRYGPGGLRHTVTATDRSTGVPALTSTELVLLP